MQRLADYYNNYEIEIDSNYLKEEEKEKLGDLLKYYKDYRITMLDKYKLIAYYDLDFEPVQDDSIYNIYHLVIENDNKFGSYGIYANGILVESTDEAGLSRFSGYEKIKKDWMARKSFQNFCFYLRKFSALYNLTALLYPCYAPIN
jgi:hypothetical protein